MAPVAQAHRHAGRPLGLRFAYGQGRRRRRCRQFRAAARAQLPARRALVGPLRRGPVPRQADLCGDLRRAPAQHHIARLRGPARSPAIAWDHPLRCAAGTAHVRRQSRRFCAVRNRERLSVARSGPGAAWHRDPQRGADPQPRRLRQSLQPAIERGLSVSGERHDHAWHRRDLQPLAQPRAAARSQRTRAVHAERRRAHCCQYRVAARAARQCVATGAGALARAGAQSGRSRRHPAGRARAGRRAPDHGLGNQGPGALSRAQFPRRESARGRRLCLHRGLHAGQAHQRHRRHQFPRVERQRLRRRPRSIGQRPAARDLGRRLSLSVRWLHLHCGGAVPIGPADQFRARCPHFRDAGPERRRPVVRGELRRQFRSLSRRAAQRGTPAVVGKRRCRRPLCAADRVRPG